MRLLDAATLDCAASDVCVVASSGSVLSLVGWGTSGFTLLNSDLSGNPEGARGQLSLLNYS